MLLLLLFLYGEYEIIPEKKKVNKNRKNLWNEKKKKKVKIILIMPLRTPTNFLTDKGIEDYRVKYLGHSYVSGQS